MMIVLPESHPRSADHSMPLAALAPEPLVLFPRAIGPGLHDSIIASCQRAGFSPKLGQQASQAASIIHMVAAGFGVSLVPQSLSQIHPEGVAYLRIDGEAPRAPISLAYRRDDRSTASAISSPSRDNPPNRRLSRSKNPRTESPEPDPWLPRVRRGS